MLKIFKCLKFALPQILLIFVLLIIQAWGDLALPQYTSDIVNIGIQQGGIENAAARAISEDSAEYLFLFTDNAARAVFDGSYTLITPETADDTMKSDFPACKSINVYFLNDGADTAAVSKALSLPMMLCSMLEELSFDDFAEKMPGLSSAGNITSYDDLLGMMGVSTTNATALSVFKALSDTGMMSEDITDSFSSVSEMPDSIVEQGGASYVLKEYKALGADTERIQSNYLFGTGAVMLLIAFMMMSISIIIGFISSRVAASAGMRLRGAVFKNVVAFSNTEIDKFSTASLITRTTNDIQQIQIVTVIMLRMVMYAPILGVGGIIKVVSGNAGMGWIIFIAVAAILCLVASLFFVAMPKFKIMQSLVDRLNLVAREILTGLPVIRAFSRERYEEKRFDKANRDLTGTMLFTNRVMTFMMPSMMLIMNLITVLIIWVGADKIGTGDIQVGDMIAFITYTMQIVLSFLMITAISVFLPRAAISAERIDEVIKASPSVLDSAQPKKLDKDSLKGVVTFENVSFHYPDADENVIMDISFTARPGETTAIIGSTGSGKSTLINLIPRFFDVTDGAITIDGTDIRELAQHDLRDMIGYVPQKGVLFSGTVMSNLKFGGDDITDDDVKAAAEISQSAQFISEKPDKYNEPIAQGGTNVSGGQKQRLSIARAIAKRPKIFIFDDSFSALDFKTDVALRKALSDNISDSTVIIVAQRISTILHAQQIIVLDEGMIVGKGTHGQLMESCEVYRQIAVSQLSQKDLDSMTDSAKGVG